MANRAYVSIFCRDFSETAQLQRFFELLSTVPFSSSRPGFSDLVIRAVSLSETPVRELDLRASPLDAAGVIEIAQETLHGDMAYETEAHWDLWVFNVSNLRWEQQPQPLEIVSYGEEFDERAWQDSGHFQIGIGFEHLFTGHAGLLGTPGHGRPEPQHPAEAAFLSLMNAPGKLEQYHEKTRSNIRQLLDWTEQIERRMPVQKLQLWSEGEENFEARLGGILAAR
jgi:hypothetical protein